MRMGWYPVASPRAPPTLPIDHQISEPTPSRIAGVPAAPSGSNTYRWGIMKRATVARESTVVASPGDSARMAPTMSSTRITAKPSGAPTAKAPPTTAVPTNQGSGWSAKVRWRDLDSWPGSAVGTSPSSVAVIGVVAGHSRFRCIGGEQRRSSVSIRSGRWPVVARRSTLRRLRRLAGGGLDGRRHIGWPGIDVDGGDDLSDLIELDRLSVDDGLVRRRR